MALKASAQCYSKAKWYPNIPRSLDHLTFLLERVKKIIKQNKLTTSSCSLSPHSIFYIPVFFISLLLKQTLHLWYLGLPRDTQMLPTNGFIWAHEAKHRVISVQPLYVAPPQAHASTRPTLRRRRWARYWPRSGPFVNQSCINAEPAPLKHMRPSGLRAKRRTHARGPKKSNHKTHFI